MKIISRYFSFEGADDRWDRMANVLRKSCDAHGLDHDVQEMPVPQRCRGAAVCANHAKLKEWRDCVLTANEPIILADVDVFIQRNPIAGFHAVENVGITYRDQGGPPIPLNAGIVFVQPTETSRKFFIDWCDMDARLWAEGSEFMRWRKKYQGMNQASLGALMETTGFKPTRLNCSKWNLVEPWDNPEKAAIVHIKGNCMRHIFDGEKPRYDNVIKIKNEWMKIENHNA